MNPETEFREGLEELAAHYKSVLTLLGEDPARVAGVWYLAQLPIQQ